MKLSLMNRGNVAVQESFRQIAGPCQQFSILPVRMNRVQHLHHSLASQRNLRSLICHASTIPKPPEAVTNSPWTGSQQQIEALSRLTERSKDLPGAPLDEDMLKWFLRDRDFDIEEAVDKLRKATKWREKVRPDALSEDDVFQQISLGKGYIHESLDRFGRPVLVVRVAKHFAGARGEPEASQKLCAYLMETALLKLPKDGETVLGIFDFEGAGPQNIDLEFAKFLIDMFFSYYPKRLGQVLMVDAPWIFQPPWQVIKPLLRKYASLVRFCKAETVRQEYFTPETLPPAFKR